MRTKVEWALRLAEQGFWVFRIIDNGKVPRKDGWQNEATRDPDRICELWNETPKANIGAFTSKFGDEGKALCVIDVDMKNGKDGNATLDALEDEGYLLTETAENETPTKGRHIIYVCDQPVKQGAGVLGDGIDIRSRGGYIVMAGSTIDGIPYVWRNRPVRTAPGWLYAKLALATTTRAQTKVNLASVNSERAFKRSQDFIAGAPLPEPGERNNTAFMLAAEIKDRGCNQAACHELMIGWNDMLPDPMDDEELEAVVASAYKNSQNVQPVKAPDAIFSPVEKGTITINGPTVLGPLEQMNEKFALVMSGGSHAILWQNQDMFGRPVDDLISEQSFHKLMAAHIMEVGKDKEAISKVWMAWGNRRTYHGIVYAPMEDIDGRFFNLFRGWAVQPFGPDETPSKAAVKSLAMWKEHVLVNQCHNNIPLYNWTIARYAVIFQKPSLKISNAIAIQGAKGTGKNSLIEPLLFLAGRHGLLVDNPRYLASNFNGHLQGLSILACDEAFWSGDKPLEGIMKGLISGTSLNIERKGLEAITVRNLVNVFILGNDKSIVPATEDERRFAMYEMGTGRQKDTAFFGQMKSGFEDGGYRLLLEYLMTYDISEYDLNTVPQTKALIDQKHENLDTLDQFILDCLHHGLMIDARVTTRFQDFSVQVFREALQQYTRNRNIRGRLPSESAIGEKLHKIFPAIKRTRVRIGGSGLGYNYITPSVAQMRQDWQRYIGARPGDIKWQNEITETTGELSCLM